MDETLSLEDFGTLKMEEPWEAPVGPEHDPDRWQAILPQPYRMIDELLAEIIDDVLLGRAACCHWTFVNDVSGNDRPHGPLHTRNSMQSTQTRPPLAMEAQRPALRRTRRF